MGFLVDLISLAQQGYGWILVLVLFCYEIFWPFTQTRLQRFFERTEKQVSETVDDARKDLNDRMDGIEDKVDETATMQKSHIQVTRAVSRDMDGINEEAVDDYLVENGVEVSDFLMSGHGSHGDD
jgi:hypothetical protein